MNQIILSASVITVIISIIIIIIVIIKFALNSYNSNDTNDTDDDNTRLPEIILALDSNEPESRPSTCTSIHEWRTLQNDQKCGNILNGISWRSINPDKCNSDVDKLSAGSWACIPGKTNTTTTLAPVVPASPIDICNANSVYKQTTDTIECNSTKDSAIYIDYNQKLCALNNNKLPIGTWACIPRTRGYENPTISSPRISSVNWINESIWKSPNIVKSILKKIYTTDFKYSSEQEFLKDWRPLHLQGGGFTNSVRIKENVEYGNNGLSLHTKEIKQGNIDDTAYKVIKNNDIFKNFKYTTAGISSKIAFGYGYYESTYKYAESQDIDNAFWLTNVYNPSWEGWEVDINEGWFGTNTDDYKFTILKWGNGYSGGVNTSKKGNFPKSTRINQLKNYNTFGLLYTPVLMVGYVNDIPIFNATPKNKFTQLKNKKGKPIGFVSGNMEVKFSNGRTGTSDKVDSLVNSIMNVKSFTYYG